MSILTLFAVNKKEALFGLFLLMVYSASAVDMGELRINPSRYGISIEWDIATPDEDHDATADVRYRVQGGDWKEAQPLMRIDRSGWNMMSGSILFLKPSTAYDVELSYSDPDTGTASAVRSVTTISVPVKPDGPVYHVDEGSGGTGTEADPYGIEDAIAAAKPGDTFLIHAGDYSGSKIFDAAGTEDNYVVYKGAGDGEALFTRFRVQADYNWFEGLKLVAGDDCTGIDTYGDSVSNTPKSIVITKMFITGAVGCESHYLIHGKPHARNWYITDNIIIGPHEHDKDTFGGEGIDMGHHTSDQTGHTIAYNRISNTADGISYTGGNVDIFGNDIFNVSDDGIEPDYASANVRVYNNRITLAQNNAVSLQDFSGMPWYVIGNQIISFEEGALKIREHAAFAFYHNTVVNYNSMSLWQSEYSLWGKHKNNIMVSANSGWMWNFKSTNPDWITDIDYNAFDWGAHATPFTFGGTAYSELQAYSDASGLDTHSLAIEKQSCFPDLVCDGSPPTIIPLQTLVLDSGCTAIDKGVVLPNINDDYLGIAPDMGAFEYGAEPLHFGPRENPCDEDYDGYSSIACGGDDCNDQDANVHPGAFEICENNRDDDCQDGDVDCTECAQGLIGVKCLCAGTAYSDGYCCNEIWHADECAPCLGDDDEDYVISPSELFASIQKYLDGEIPSVDMMSIVSNWKSMCR